METLCIRTGADLCAQPRAFLDAHFGSFATYLYGAARGEDHRPVRADRPSKSIGPERTFFDDLSDRDALHAPLENLPDAACQRVQRHGPHGRTVPLQLRYVAFLPLTLPRPHLPPTAHRPLLPPPPLPLLP